MGFSIAWLAVRGLDRSKILQRFGLHDTGEAEDFPDAPVCGAELPEGAYLLYLDDCFHRFVSPEFLCKASKDCAILGCQVEEHIMASSSFFYQNGKRQWNLVHESDKGIDHLDSAGNLPEPFHKIYQEAVESQRQEDAQTLKPNKVLGVDYIFDVPVRLATALSGYSHNRAEYPWGRPKFTKLREGRRT